MCPGKERQRSIGGADEIKWVFGHTTDGIDIADEIVMCQLHSLRLTRRTRCVDQSGKIVGSGGNDWRGFSRGVFNGRSKGMWLSRGCVEAKRAIYQRRVGKDFLHGPYEDVLRAAE